MVILATDYYVLRQGDAVLLIREQEGSWRVRKSTLSRIAYLERTLSDAVFHTIAYRMPQVVRFEPPEPLPREKAVFDPARGDTRPYRAVYDGPPQPLMPLELLAQYEPLTSMQLVEFQRHEDRIAGQLEQEISPDEDLAMIPMAKY